MIEEINSTADIEVPTDPLDCIIGQEDAVNKVKVSVRQKRHLLLVGPPGTGKSMIAQAMANHIHKPTEQVYILENRENPHHPKIEIVGRESVVLERITNSSVGVEVSPQEVPSFVSERLGFRCSHCGVISSHAYSICPECGGDKCSRVRRSQESGIYGHLITDVFEVGSAKAEKEVYTTRINSKGIEETIVYQRIGDKIRILNQTALDHLRKVKEKSQKRVLIPLDRNTFVQATGASETELLGDVRHDPYGSHPEIGTPTYKRVVPGAIHEAHQGVLFVDELPQLDRLQTFILTAMQEKRFPITGRNPQSSGAIVKVDSVPCDFLFVGACNIADVGGILPPLRSRIAGSGYEVLLEATMPDSDENREKLVRFVAQEIIRDGRIPHADMGAVETIISEASRRARVIDGKPNCLSLRLRDLGGVIRMAGDIATMNEENMIKKEHIEKGLKQSKPIEHQLEEKYGSVWAGADKDKGIVLDKDASVRGYG